MNAATLMAFQNELEKIAFFKSSGLLRDVGTRIISTAKSAKKITQGGVKNVGNAVGAFATPAESFKRGWKTTTTDFGSMSKPLKGMMALGLVTGGHEALSKDDPYGNNRGRAERVGAVAGDQLGGIVGAPFGLAGGVAAGMIGRKVGGTLGKGVDLLRKSKER